MKLASYLATRPGYQGIANRAIRLRFGGSFFHDGEASHTELVFVPGDGVDHLMPDGTCEPTAEGAYWCASSVAAEKLPAWSKKRAGKTGGVRFKRVVLDNGKWELADLQDDSLAAAQWFWDHEGDRYDWGLALSFLSWPFMFVFKQLSNCWSCAASCAAALRKRRPEFFHPALMRVLFPRR
jgi:hypothetical protein